MTIEKGPTFQYADIRYVVTGSLNAVNPAWLRISMNPAIGDGGTCYGDSGGRQFPWGVEPAGGEDDHRRLHVPGDQRCLPA